MRLDASLIVELRGRRAWSQEHLALVAGISHRTVQRVENEGNASLETAKALASAFAMEIGELQQNVETNSPKFQRRARLAAMSLIMVVALAGSLFLSSMTSASKGVQISANVVEGSHDHATTKFIGDVEMIIPESVPFVIAAASPGALPAQAFQGQMEIKLDQASVMLIDAQISNFEGGLKVKAHEALWIDPFGLSR
ncbi:MAG: helix-turn-helix transcriptional regulator [Pseudomonadota bacterium]